jgi:cysteinyl-tRNA synthetase
VCAQLFGLVTEVNRLLDAGDEAAAAPLVAAWHTILDAVGLEVRSDEAAVPDEITELARQRDEARAARDWAAADALRDQITAAGFVVEDSSSGTLVRPG